MRFLPYAGGGSVVCRSVLSVAFASQKLHLARWRGDYAAPTCRRRSRRLTMLRHAAPRLNTVPFHSNCVHDRPLKTFVQKSFILPTSLNRRGVVISSDIYVCVTLLNKRETRRRCGGRPESPHKKSPSPLDKLTKPCYNTSCKKGADDISAERKRIRFDLRLSESK